MKKITRKIAENTHLLFILFGIILLVGLAIFISTFTLRINKIKTTIQYAPYIAEVTLNDVPVNNNSDIWLEPGSYTVKVKCDHFSSIERTIEISNDYHYIVGILSATDDEGRSYANLHKQEFANAEGIVGRALNEEGIAIKKQYPILNYLPINNSLFSISYTYLEDNIPLIKIKTTPEFLDDAVAKMKTFKNVELTDYQISFNLENPFDTYNESPKSTPKETIKSSFNLGKYTISNGQNLIDNYYATTLYIYDFDRDFSYNHYRILLKKDGENWHIISKPQPLLTKDNTPNVPQDILNSANSLAP